MNPVTLPPTAADRWEEEHMNVITVLLAEDHAVVREATAEVVNHQSTKT